MTFGGDLAAEVNQETLELVSVQADWLARFCSFLQYSNLVTTLFFGELQ